MDAEEVDGVASTLETSMGSGGSDATERIDQKKCPVGGSIWIVAGSDGRKKRFMTRAHAPWSPTPLARLEFVSTLLGVKEGPRVLGDYVLSQDDSLGEARFDGMVAACAYGIDIHDPDGGEARGGGAVRQ